MNKRDTILVVYRITVMFILFSIISNVPIAISTVFGSEIIPTPLVSKVILSALLIALPLGITYLL